MLKTRKKLCRRQNAIFVAALALALGACGEAWATFGTYKYNDDQTGDANITTSGASIGCAESSLTITGSVAEGESNTLYNVNVSASGDGALLGTEISVTADNKGSGATYGVYNKGQITITAKTSVSISATGAAATYGVRGDSGSSTTISCAKDSNSAIKISASSSSESSQAAGVYANGGTITLGDDNTTSVEISATGTYSAYGINGAAADSQTKVTGQQVAISATGSGVTYGVFGNNSSSSAIITGTNEIKISAETSGAAKNSAGVYNIGTTEITGGAVSISATNTATENVTGDVYGAYNSNSFKMTGSEIAVNAQGGGKTAGIYNSGGTTVIGDGTIASVKIGATGSGIVYGLYDYSSSASGDSGTTITGANIEISATGTDGRTVGVYNDQSATTIKGGSVTVSATSAAATYGIYGYRAGTTTITGGENSVVVISAIGTGSSLTSGIYSDGSATKIEGGSVTISALGAGNASAYGISYGSGSGATTIKGATVTITAASASLAYGVSGSHDGDTVAITGSTVSITATGSGTYRTSGLYNNGGASTAIKAASGAGSSIEITGTGTGEGDTYGIYERNVADDDGSVSDGSTTIAGDENTTVKISAAGTGASRIAGIYNEGAGGKTEITGGAIDISAVGAVSTYGVYNYNSSAGAMIKGSGANSIVSISATGSGESRTIGFYNDASVGAIDSASVSIYAEGASSTYGVYGYNLGSKITITGDDIKIGAVGTGAATSENAALGSVGAGATSGEGRDLALGAETAIPASDGSESASNATIIVTGGNVAISAAGAGSSRICGIYNDAGTSENEGEETPTAAAGSYGVYGYTQDSVIIITGDSVRISAESSSANGYGVFSLESPITVTGTSIEIAGTSATNARGVYSSDSGLVTIGDAEKTQNIIITAQGAASSIALVAENSGEIYVAGGGTTQVAGDVSALTEGTVTADFTGADSFLEGAVTTDETGTTDLKFRSGAVWNVTGPSTVTRLTGSDAVFNIDTGAAVTVDELEGTGATLNFETTSDLATGSLKVYSGADASELRVNYQGITADDIADDAALQNLVEQSLYIDSGSNAGASVSIAEGIVSGAITADTINNIEGNEITSVARASGPTSGMEAIKAVAAASIIAWREEDATLSQRLGELREADGGQGIWARVSRGEFKYSGEYENEYTFLQIGYDFGAGDWHYGLAVSHNDGETSYDIGRGDNESTSLSVYGTWLGVNGHYLDVVGKVGRLSTDYDLYIASGKVHGSYETNGFALSGEYGRKFALARDFYVTPLAKLSLMHIGSKDHSTSSGVTIEQEKLRSTLGRLGLEAGKRFGREGSYEGGVYFKASYLHEFSGAAKTILRSGKFRNSYTSAIGSNWWELGLGATYRAKDMIYFYADVVRTFGDDFSTPWQWNVGAYWKF